MAKSTAMSTIGRRLLGVAFLLVPALLIWLSVAIYNKRFTDPLMVTLRTGTAGHEMHRQADVKVRGVVIGEVRSITTNGSGGATLKLALQPDKAKFITNDTQARLLPTTLFGARYVSLVAPPVTSGGQIREGATISEDRSKNAIELSEVLNNTMRLLNSIKPAKLQATLTAFAQALEGRGDRLGANLQRLGEFLRKLNPELPALTNNFNELAKWVNSAADAAPDLVQAVNDSAATARTIVDQKEELLDLFDTLTRSSQRLEDFLRDNDDVIIALSAESRRSLELFRRYSPSAPCTFRTLADFVPVMNKVLGQGTDEHGVHVEVSTVQHKGRYIPGRDRPRFTAGGGPRCFSVPFTPGGGRAPRILPLGAPVPGAVSSGGLGPANSASENELVNQLLAPGLDEVPEGMPDWSGVLVGPIYRGAEVKIR